MATAAAPRVYKNFINGEWVDSRSGTAYENRNPANTDEFVVPYHGRPPAGAGCVTRTCRAQHKELQVRVHAASRGLYTSAATARA